MSQMRRPRHRGNKKFVQDQIGSKWQSQDLLESEEVIILVSDSLKNKLCLYLHVLYKLCRSYKKFNLTFFQVIHYLIQG